MAGHKPWNTLIDKMPPERRAKYDQAREQRRIGRLVEEMRHAAGMTQVQLAEKAGVSQPRISAIENGDEVVVTTLEKVVTAMGGQIVIHMPTGDFPLATAPR